jgi:hypothetical protein
MGEPPALGNLGVLCIDQPVRQTAALAGAMRIRQGTDRVSIDALPCIFCARAVAWAKNVMQASLIFPGVSRVAIQKRVWQMCWAAHLS